MIASALDFDRIDIDDVTKQYGRRRALSKASFSASAGDVIVLLGPNGAGKSTLLNILSSLLRPTSGQIRYGSATPAGAGDRLRARIGFLGHELFLYSDLTARENLEFAARLYRLPDVAALVERGLTRALLVDRADDRVGGLVCGVRK
mgnify:CR=1 FL=1